MWNDEWDDLIQIEDTKVTAIDICVIISVIIIGILLIIGFIRLCIGVFNYADSYESPQDVKWNHGVCVECNTPWHYKEAVGHRLDTTYIYECECGQHYFESYELH